jgi:5-formyltetrahydrofolate cyclo-ligase
VAISTKDEIRRYVWTILEEHGVALFPKPITGRIPNFIGAAKAAERLRTLPEYQDAKTVFCNPDSPQRPIRELVLKDGKILIMATPRLKGGFLLLNPENIPRNLIREASSIRGALKYGCSTDLLQVKVDLFVAGSVAVSIDGGRLGKGTGYSDQEYAILKSKNAISPGAPVVTTIHDLQIVGYIPRESWDIPVDIIVTPTRVIRARK